MTEFPVGGRQESLQRGGLSNDARLMMMFEANKKSALIAYLLWISFGLFGAHNFYLKRTRIAVAQLILKLTGIGMIVSLIWIIVDAFRIPGLVRDQNHLLITQLAA